MARNTILLDDDASLLIKIRLSDDYRKRFSTGRNTNGLWEEINFQLGGLYSVEILKNKFTQLISYYNLCRNKGEKTWKHFKEIDELIGDGEKNGTMRINLSDGNIQRVKSQLINKNQLINKKNKKFKAKNKKEIIEKNDNNKKIIFNDFFSPTSKKNNFISFKNMKVNNYAKEKILSKKEKKKILIEEMKILKGNLQTAQENLNSFIEKYF